jgi:hypothetical protein
MVVEDARSMNVQCQGCVGDAQPALSEIRWKVGYEAPPFSASNVVLVQMLKSIVDGTIDVIPTVVVSNAVAVQIYNLIFDNSTRAKELAGQAGRGLYVILASLVRGTRTEPADKIEADKLRLLLGRLAAVVRSPSSRWCSQELYYYYYYYYYYY